MGSMTCDECGFDGRVWTVNDAIRTLHPLGVWWREIVDGVSSAEVLALAIEAGAALTSAAAAMLEAVGDPAASPAGPPGPGGPEPSDPTLAAAIAELDRIGLRVVGGLSAVPASTWASDPAATGLLLDLVHRATHDLRRASRATRRAGGGSPSMRGTIVGLHRSAGGVPKLPVDRAEIDAGGVQGDRQATRKHHGRPWQALCLWSAEVIAELQDEGHPIAAGAAGENVTLAGLDWDAVRPGAQLRIGTALAEVSLYALPCAKNAQWFADGDFNRMLHSRHAGSSRLYAWVLEPGTARVGDTVLVEPD